jgi:hypothetical protein
MAKEKAEQLEKRTIPNSLKKVLEKLPTPEAIQVLEDIGAAAWIIDNNNNNKAAVMDELFLTKLATLPAYKLKEILDFKE